MSHDSARRREGDQTSTPCEICGSGQQAVETEACAFGERLLWLCAEHRARADAESSSEALCSLWREPNGLRRLLPRRLEDRRVFPPRPEGRRRGSGRRRSDPEV